MRKVFVVFEIVQGLAARIGDAVRWLPPLFGRIVVGTVFVQSGWGKLHNLAQVTDYFTELGLPAPAFQAVLASSTEFVCGALLLAGLLTRFAAVPLIITMTVAIRTALWDQVDGIASLFGLVEFLYIAILVWLAVGGPGAVSADRVFGTFAAPREPAPRADAKLMSVA